MELKKYAVLTYLSDGIEVYDPLHLDGEDDQATIDAKVLEVCEETGTSQIDIVTRYRYERIEETEQNV